MAVSGLLQSLGLKGGLFFFIQLEEMSTAPVSEAKVLSKVVAFLLVSCVALSAFFFLVNLVVHLSVIFLHIKTGKGEV